ncbi:hypothetical protein [Bradyrhizobium sp. Ec3.3]|uniref:hypothetical protein n=1 Tax=Bradyrhizobium sp. Ec3.3 TaxID=189753 RepID=UPI0018DD788A|nr:hypothetical protein [Bradyrhizobium sp. Ec3.3]
MADTTNATMSHAAAMSPTHTASSYPATCSRSGTAATTATTAAATATATTAATTAATATATATSEQRPGRRNQQCRYCSYCKKLCYPRHDDLLFAFNSASSSRLHCGARR